jgi:integrase
MSIQRLPSQMWRAQIYDPATRKNVSVSKILGGPGTFKTKTEAKQARARARDRLATSDRTYTTVRAFSERWLDDPIFQEWRQGRVKESTMIRRAEGIQAFVDRYGDLRMDQIDDDIAVQWISGGKHTWTVPQLRKMFADAQSKKGGRLIVTNPFADLGLSKSKGNQARQPPTEKEFWRLVETAWRITPPSFAGWLELACYTGLRPGEIDALRPTDIDLERQEIRVDRQWNSATHTFTTPKYGPYVAALTDPVLGLLERVPVGGMYVFETLRRNHYTATSRTHHWNRVRCTVGTDSTLYLATRHHFGWYALNILGLEPAVIAVQLGHKDGGKLVELLYGHRDQNLAREKIRQAYRARPANVTPLRRIGESA